MNTLELNRQEVSFLLAELDIIIEDPNYSNTNKAVAKGLYDKLTELKQYERDN